MIDRTAVGKNRLEFVEMLHRHGQRLHDQPGQIARITEHFFSDLIGFMTRPDDDEQLAALASLLQTFWADVAFNLGLEEQDHMSEALRQRVESTVRQMAHAMQSFALDHRGKMLQPADLADDELWGVQAWHVLSTAAARYVVRMNEINTSQVESPLEQGS